jgi:hypothetical protein
MPGYVQIEGDPTQWWLDSGQSVDVSQLTKKALSIKITAPLTGTLLISPKAGSIAIFENPRGAVAPGPVPHLAPTVYVPTATGPSAGSAGFDLPSSVNLSDLASQIATAMSKGSSQTVPLDGATLALNGATVPFVVLSVVTGVGGAVPHP